MSPHAANSLVHDLVEMAKAMETLPLVQAQLAEAEAKNNFQLETIQRLELKLIDRTAEIDVANAATRKAEAERDSAESMFLETDDKLLAFRRLVSAFSTDAASLLRAQEPEPTTQPPQAGPSIDDGGPYNSPMVEQAIREDIVHLEATSDPIPTSGQSEVGEPVTSTEAIPVSVDTVSSSLEPVHSDLVQPTEPNPTVGSPVGPTASLASAAPAPAASVADAPEDDVGYHNEPDADMAHSHWEDWAGRMSRRYGADSWPKRWA